MAHRRALGIGRVFAFTFLLWFRGLLPFTFLAVLFYSPRILHRIEWRPRFNDSAYVWETLLVDQLLLMPVVAAVIHSVLERLRGRRAGIGACLRVAISRWLPTVGVTLYVHLLVVLAMCPFLFLAQVHPAWTIGAGICGVLVLGRYWLALPAAVVERKGIGASLRRSVDLSRGSKGPIFTIVAVFYSGWFIAVSMLTFTTPYRFDTGWIVLGVLRGTLMAVASAVAYYDLKVAKEGVPTEDLVRVFG